MIQTVATMISLMVALAAMLVIAVSVSEEWQSLRGALARYPAAELPALPARIRMLPSPRRARMLRITPESSASQAAA